MPRSIRFKLGVSTALAALALVAPASASATVKLGVFNSGGPTNTATVGNYLSEVGAQPALTLWYTNFGSTLLTSEQASVLRETGQAPIVTWEPYDQSLSAIAGGSYDSYLRSSARLAKSFGSELMVRFAHEMNGTWYPWSGNATTYVAAWRHIVSIFREEGATNVKWVWAPNVDRTGSMPFSAYFPGEEWVDYIGLDGYNFGTYDGNRWLTLEEVFSASYAKITALSAKPLIITETGSNELGGNKAEWIRTGFTKTIPQDFPRVTGVIWFNKEQEGVNWRVDSSLASLEAFREVANCTIYGGSKSCETNSGAIEDAVPVTETSSTGEASPTGEAPSVDEAPAVEVTVPSRVKKRAGKKKHSAKLSYKISDPARVSVRLQLRERNGYRFRGSYVRLSHAGRTALPLRKLIGRHELAEGSYRVTVVAHGVNGHTSRSRHAHFRVL